MGIVKSFLVEELGLNPYFAYLVSYNCLQTLSIKSYMANKICIHELKLLS